MTSVPIDLKNKALETQNIPAAIVCADQESILSAIEEVIQDNLVKPILIGNRKLIENEAAKIDFKLNKIELLESNSEEHSADIACELASTNKIKIIIKGNLHTDILMRSYLKKEFNLIQGKRLSHIWHLTSSTLKKPLYITDGALNVLPRLEVKMQILKNVIEFFKKLNKSDPKVAILSATEDPIKSMPSSIEAKQIMELANKEKIKALIQGPLAFDNAVSKEAAEIKNISNEVAGNADILLVPNIETGNSLSKMMVYFMDACAAGVIVGGKTPVVLPSRADNKISKISSIMAAIVASQTE
tara:strand:- start:2642 stop:3544 length:903 start_codon:yes stop_codon:yes gene_type:complete